MTVWLDALARLERAEQPAVLVTVAVARGSTPREAGCKMVVTATEQFDTIGGGALEFTCVGIARDLLAGPGDIVLRAFPLGPGLGQCCGGHVTVLFEPMLPPAQPIVIFGAGHVGRALASLLAGLQLPATLIDSRPETLAAAPDGVRTRHAANPAEMVAGLATGSIVLVMTHDHQLDFDIVAASLARPDLRAVCLIGSATKRARFVRRLDALGLPVASLICPIGVPGANGKRPAEIAVAVAAQLLQLRHSDAPLPVHATNEQACGDCAGGCEASDLSERLA